MNSNGNKIAAMIFAGVIATNCLVALANYPEPPIQSVIYNGIIKGEVYNYLTEEYEEPNCSTDMECAIKYESIPDCSDDCREDYILDAMTDD